MRKNLNSAGSDKLIQKIKQNLEKRKSEVPRFSSNTH